MSRKTRTLTSFRKEIEKAVQDGKLLERTTPLNTYDRSLGMRIRSRRIYTISKEFKEFSRAVIEKNLEVYGKNILHEDEVEEVLWNLICDNTKPEDVFKDFKENLLERVSALSRVIIPNFQLRFEPGLEEIQIGPVRAVLGNKLADELSKDSRETWKRPGSYEERLSEAGDHTYCIDSVCWDVQIKASDQLLHQQAVWESNVALSLLRVIVVGKNGYAMVPQYGDEEMPIGHRFDGRSIVLLAKEEIFYSRRLGVPHHYHISHEDARELATERSRQKITQIFEAKQGSVAERVKRGLGWLARARQMQDQAERHLYFCTSIEAILTSGDNDAKVTESIGRNGSIILTDNNHDRLENYQMIVQSYDVRSRIVHGGSKSVSREEARLIQEIAETLYQKVILLTDISDSYKNFQQSFKAASFGMSWSGILRPE